MYHSLTDVGVAFAVVYCNMFLMLNRAELFARVREAAVIAREVESLQSPSKAMQNDIRMTVKQVQVIFGVGASHAYAMFVLFMIPTLMTGESPSPLVPRDKVPLELRYIIYIAQVGLAHQNARVYGSGKKTHK